MTEPTSMDRLFKALADKNRRRVLDIVKDRPGLNTNSVCAFFKISRIGVLKHLRILERARLILGKKEGRQRRLYLNAVPIQMMHDRWMSRYSVLWAKGLTRLKYGLETSDHPVKHKEIKR